MSAWFERLVDPEYATPAMWIVSGLLLAILLLVLVRLLRGFASGTFVAGGRNRRARLAVMDAAAVDSRRRLVLVRRDDVEHLILIGGPTDLVVEQDIRMVTPGRRHTDMEPEAPAAPQPAPLPAKAREPAVEAPRPRLVSPPPPPAPVKPPERSFPAAPARDSAYPARPAATAAPVPPTPRPAPAVAIERPPPAEPAESMPEPRVEPVAPRSFEPPPPAEPRPQPAPETNVVAPVPVTPEPAAPPPAPPIAADDEALLKELEVTLDTTDRKQADDGPDDISLEEEMSKLLGDLSGDRR